MKNIKDKAVVVFADVTLNTKNAYIASTGEFTAPVRGHYTFTLTISTTQGALFSTQLAINGNSVCYNYIKGISSGKKKTTRSCPQPPLVKWRQMTWLLYDCMIRECLPIKCGLHFLDLYCKIHVQIIVHA